jgi:hypothetical protein
LGNNDIKEPNERTNICFVFLIIDESIDKAFTREVILVNVPIQIRKHTILVNFFPNAEKSIKQFFMARHPSQGIAQEIDACNDNVVRVAKVPQVQSILATITSFPNSGRPIRTSRLIFKIDLWKICFLIPQSPPHLPTQKLLQLPCIAIS